MFPARPLLLFLNQTDTIVRWKSRLSSTDEFVLGEVSSEQPTLRWKEKGILQGAIPSGNKVHAFIFENLKDDLLEQAIKEKLQVILAIRRGDWFIQSDTLRVFAITRDEATFQRLKKAFRHLADLEDDFFDVEFHRLHSPPDVDREGELRALTDKMKAHLPPQPSKVPASESPSKPRSITQLQRQRAEWFEQLLAQSGFWDMTCLTDVLTGEVYFSREAYVVSVTAIYEPKFRAHLELAKSVNLTIKALPQTTLGQLTLIIKPAELDVSVKDNSPFANHPD